MGRREEEYWEQFCKTGLIADYLAYRGAVGCRRKTPEDGCVPEEEGQDAGRDQRGRAFG